MKHALHMLVDASAHQDAPSLELSVDRQLRARVGSRNVLIHLASATDQASMRHGMRESLQDDVGLYIPIVSEKYIDDADAYLRYRTYSEFERSPYSFNVFPLMAEPQPSAASLSPAQQQWMSAILQKPVSLLGTQGIIDDAWLNAIEFHMDLLGSVVESARAMRLSDASDRRVRFPRDGETTSILTRKSWFKRLHKVFVRRPPADRPIRQSLNAKYEVLTITQKSIVRLLYLYVEGDQVTLTDFYRRYVDAYGEEAILGHGEFYYRLRSLCEDGLLLMESVSKDSSVIRKLPTAEVYVLEDLDS